MKYTLLDAGNGKKLEKFGKYTLIRPCPQAIWNPFNSKLWSEYDAEFEKISGEKGQWRENTKLPKSFEVENQNGIKFLIEPNEFGNLGVFTEHWIYTSELLEKFTPKETVLNLFSYTGSSCLELAKKGFPITLVDSSRNALTTYTTNLELNRISRDGQRFIHEDAISFVEREIRRGNSYRNILIDTPSFGRGVKKNEVFEIDSDFVQLVGAVKKVLDPNGVAVFTLHSPRFTIASLEIFFKQMFNNYTVSVNEILNPCGSGVSIPSGTKIVIEK